MRPLEQPRNPLAAPTDTSNHICTLYTLPPIFMEIQPELNSTLILSQIRTIHLSLKSRIIAAYPDSIEDAIGPPVCDSKPKG